MTDGFYIYNNRNLTQLYLKNIQNIQVGADMKTGVEYVHQKFCFSEHEKAAISPNSSLRHCSEPCKIHPGKEDQFKYFQMSAPI